MGPLSRLVGKPPISPWVSADFLPLTQFVNNTNSAIPLTEIFDRVFSDVCNSLGFEVQKQKKRGSGNNRVYRNLNVGKVHQLAMRDPTDKIDLPDHVAYQMNIAFEAIDVSDTSQVNNGVVYLDYEDSHHHGPLLCSFQ